MALTKENREIVKNFVWNTLMAECDRKFNTLQLRSLVKSNLDIDLSAQAIGSIMACDAPNKYHLVSRKNYYNHVFYMLTRVNTYMLKKERSQVYFINDETGSKTLIYDYNATAEDGTSRVGDYDTVVIDGFTRNAYTVARLILEIPEWVFSYPDLLSSIMRTSDYTGARVLPRTLLPREKEISEEVYRIMSARWGYSLCMAFRDVHKIMTDKEFDMNVLNILTKNQLRFIIDYKLIERFDGIKNALAVMSMIDKFALIQIKNYESVPYDDMVHTLKEMYRLNWLSNVNTNHSFKANEEIFDAYKNEAKNRMLAEKLQKLNFLNGLEVGNEYVIVVPQTIDDLVREGQQQNNCVGKYYNDSIIAGENYIYFIRKKSDVSKSYITCRFNNFSLSTVEYRHKNNDYREHRELIGAIDTIIKENLKKKGELKNVVLAV